MFSSGRSIVEPRAIKVWEEALSALDVLSGSTSPEGYAFENVLSNVGLGVLVTGFEAYCEKRFTELQGEGIYADLPKLVRKFISREDADLIRNLGVDQQLEAVADRINFQNYANAKLAFNKGYGISFGKDVHVPTSVLEELQQLIRYRHKVVHVSPRLGMLNADRTPEQEPVFSNLQFLSNARLIFERFIPALHEATLEVAIPKGPKPYRG